MLETITKYLTILSKTYKISHYAKAIIKDVVQNFEDFVGIYECDLPFCLEWRGGESDHELLTSNPGP